MNETELKRLIEFTSGSVRAFAIENDIPYTTMRSILERGVMNAKAETVFKICSILNIRPEAFSTQSTDSPTLNMETQIAFPAMVKKYRTINDLTMEQLAEKIGKTKSTISKWESGTRSPKIQEIEEIAHFFSVDPQVMMFGKSYSPQTPDTTLEAIISTSKELEEPGRLIVLETAKTQLEAQNRATTTVSENIVDFYDARKRATATVDFAASAGTGVWQDENLGMEVTFYEEDMAENYDSIGIVMGHSMEPELKNGDYLFVRTTTDIPNGKISIWQVNGENYVKRFRKNGAPYLESLNPDYDDIPLSETDDIRPLGVVVDVYREG